VLDDIKRYEADLVGVERKVKQNERDLEAAVQESNDLKAKIEKTESAVAGFDVDSLRRDVERMEKISTKINEIETRSRAEAETIKGLERSIKKLGEVPCGDTFPTCKYIKDSHKDRELLPQKQKAFDDIAATLEELRQSFDEGALRDTRDRLEKVTGLQSKLPAARTSLQAHESRVETLKSLGDSLKEELKRVNKLLQELRAANSLTALEEVSKMQLEIEEEERKIQEATKKVLKDNQRIGAIGAEIARLEQDVERIEKLQGEWKVFETILAATGKDGIPLQIIASQLPRINLEISKVLNGVSNFNIEMFADEEGGDLEIFIDYGDSKRPIELASGMEKMIASLAIRTALIEVSAIPKPDLFIIDEGFGALDDTNLEACARLLTSLKRNFRNMLIISHVDSIKDIVDNVIEISHDGIDARVRF
jgi:exonuclease SbcC